MGIGFKGFAKPVTVDAERAKAEEANVSSDEFVIYSGNEYGRRRASGRSISLRTITEKLKPVPLSEYIKRARTAGPNGTGYGTSISVGGLSLHQIAKPTVYFYVIRDEAGNYRAKKDIPNPDRALFEKPLAAGDIVLAAPKKAPKRLAKA